MVQQMSNLMEANLRLEHLARCTTSPIPLFSVDCRVANFLTMDPYKPMTETLSSLNEPLNELLKNHRKLILTNTQSVKNIKDLQNFNLVLGDKLKQK